MRRKSLLGTIAALSLLAQAVAAQEQASSGSLTLSVGPPMPAADTPIVISGRAAPNGAARVVHLVIHKPEEKVDRQEIELNGSDAFKLDYVDTHDPGIYEIEATAPGGKDKAVVRIEIYPGSS